MILILLLIAWLYFRPFVDIDNENDQVIIHYWWKGTRKAYVI